jgi:alpha-galactosidase
LSWKLCRILLVAIGIFIVGSSVRAEERLLAPTPPMGWNSWNKFGCDINEKVIRQAADQMVASGMKDAGYTYIVIDDCWHGQRDAHGDIQPDKERFPSGIKTLADYVHSRGLKFGIYSDAGTKTCAGRPGSRGHEFQDAQQYAAWGVDYLKYDWCNTGTQNAQASYGTMSQALQATGRPIVFSLCEWGTNKPWLWAQGIGDLWRTTGDIWDHWEGKKGYSLGVMDIVDLQVGLADYAGPGHWNDPDMLEVGNGGMTTEEYRSHFSFWALLAAPLIAGNDLANMSDDTKSILMNKEVIAIDQDPLGKVGRRIRKTGDAEIWVKELSGGYRAVIMLNRSNHEGEMTLDWQDMGYPSHLEAKLHDVWKHQDIGIYRDKFSTMVPSHGVVMLKVMP